MSEGWVVVAFLLLMGLLVARMAREQRDQVAGATHLRLPGARRKPIFHFRRQHRRV
jgi:hypothetical protein